jgi:hypothetical protein
MTRVALFLTVTLTAGLALAAPPKDKPVPGDDKLLSRQPYPEVGKKVEVTVVEYTGVGEDGSLAAAKRTTKKEVGTVPAKPDWKFGADGWIDADGFNLTKIARDSGLLGLRPAAGQEQGGNMAEERDVITHIDGVAVTDVESFWYALGRAKNKKDLRIVIRDGTSGDEFLLYTTLTQVKP